MSPHLLLLLSSTFPRAAHAATGLSALSAGDLVISEMMTNPAQVRSSWGEWIEIHNRTAATVDLQGLVVSGSSGSFTVGSSVEVDAGGYAVLAVNATTNGGLPVVDYVYSFSAFELGNRSGSVTLSYSGTTFDTVAYNTTIGFPAPWGASMSLDADHVSSSDNDNGYRWCGAESVYGSGDYGTPGSANDICPLPLVDLVAGDLIISEFMPSPAGVVDRYGEWFEVTNRTGRSVNLRGLVVSSTGDAGFSVSSHIILAADGQALFSANGGSSSNGGLPGAQQTWGTAIALATADSITIADSDTVFDVVTWDSSFPLFTGAALNLDVNHLDGDDNDSANVWCAATDTYGSAGNYGTPRADNVVCLTDADGDGVTSANDCDDTDPTVNPFAEEVCDGIDNDCDTGVDEEVTTIFYADADGDGYGLTGSDLEACEQPAGYALREGDCDDTARDIFPAALEVCDDLDNDCDGDTDEYVKPLSYRDSDGDGYGDATISIRECTPPSGYVYDDSDCDDTRSESYPGNLEVCDDIDNDCDGVVDDNVKPMYYTDADGDGFGDPATGENACEQPEGKVRDHADCDDTTASIHPGATESCNSIDDDCDRAIDEDALLTFYADTDGDGYGNPYTTEEACTPSAGFVDNRSDCFDASAAVYPGAEEICDALDNDCDAQIDEEGGQSWYADADADGYGDPASTLESCAQPSGYVEDASDCDDGLAEIHPGAEETCNTLDDDCDGSIDEDAVDQSTFYADADADGFGDPTVTTEACEAPPGYIEEATDCDDALAAAYPGAEEVCDTVDNDCDQGVDEGLEQVWYADADGDGYGDPGTVVEACAQPEGFVANGEDCNDAIAAAYPGAEEVCDGLDNDCNGLSDEDVLLTFYADADEDGYGDAGSLLEACEAPDGFVADDTDCDDTFAAIHPGMEEVCDELDNDCDDQIDEGALLTWYADMDRDQYGDASFFLETCAPVSIFDSTDTTDCDDRNRAIHPGAEEVCDTVDNDCDTQIDEGLTLTWFEDDDGDGYGDAVDPLEACVQPGGFVANRDDCDDRESSIHPDAQEVCNGLDDNCDGDHDEGLTQLWYADADGDGHGNAGISIESCEQPSGFVDSSDDCSDCTAEAWDDSDGSCDIPDDCDCDPDTGTDEPEPVLQTTTLCSAEDGLHVVLDADGNYARDAVLTWVHSAWQAQIEGAEWIWSDALVTDTSVTTTVSIARDFTLPFDAAIQTATLEIAADNRYAVTLNGEEVAADSDNQNFKSADLWDVTDAMTDGDNALTFAVTNVRSVVHNPYANPAGLQYCLTIDYFSSERAPDEDLPVVSVFFADADGDGYGDASTAIEAILPPSGYVDNSEDCDDRDPEVHPTAQEICDDYDNDCDSLIDEGFETDGTYAEYYRDQDGDGYGDADALIEACAPPDGYADNGSDPDDEDATTSPELCDGYDNDGDGSVDEALVTLDFAPDSFDASLVTLSGDAVLADISGESVLELTGLDRNQRGTAMVAFPMPRDAWTVTFDFWTGGGSGADGLGLVILDPEEKNLLGSSGGGLGVLGLNGYTVEFDTWQNVYYGDPNENHVALIANTNLQVQAINASIPELEDGGWFAVEITAEEGQLTVTLNGELVLETTLPSDLPENVMLGLAGATGSATNYHLIDNMNIGCPSAAPPDEVQECTPRVFFRDADGDGHGDPAETAEACEPPPGYIEDATDCHDGLSAAYPGAAEVCDGLDNDCNGLSDEDVLLTFYADADEDGYGDAGSLLEACEAPDGFVADDTDCDDTFAAIHPGMEEVCDELDNDCNDQVDEGVTLSVWVDADEDAYGDSDRRVETCERTERQAEREGDCDDQDSAISPDAEEVCDERDNNCDGKADEGVTERFFADADGDGYGSALAAVDACLPPSGTTTDDRDCDDQNATIHPDAREQCDGLDNDCDGVASDDHIDQDGSGVSDCEEVALVISDAGATANSAHACDGRTSLEREVEVIEQALEELGLSMVMIIEDDKLGVQHGLVEPYPVVIYHNMGWSAAGSVKTATMLSEVVSAGQGLILMGDDVAKHAQSFSSSRGTQAIFEVAAITRYRNNGHRGLGMSPTRLDHPVLDGMWGTVESIPYAADIDQVDTRRRGEESLMVLDGQRAPGAWAEETEIGRTVTLMANLYASQDCPVSSEAGLESLRTLFQNAVWWVGHY